jgi:predicted HicB family RNase H-like nuclease
MNYLHYKGYLGSIEYSKADECFFGQVIGLNNSSVTYEGNNVNELQTDFEGGINDYLECCKTNGFKPEKPLLNCIETPSSTVRTTAITYKQTDVLEYA